MFPVDLPTENFWPTGGIFLPTGGIFIFFYIVDMYEKGKIKFPPSLLAFIFPRS